MPICDLSKWLLASSQHGSCVPRASVPGERAMWKPLHLLQSSFGNHLVSHPADSIYQKPSLRLAHIQGEGIGFYLLMGGRSVNLQPCQKTTTVVHSFLHIHTGLGILSFSMSNLYLHRITLRSPTTQQCPHGSQSKRKHTLSDQGHTKTTALCLEEEFCALSYWEKMDFLAEQHGLPVTESSILRQRCIPLSLVVYTWHEVLLYKALRNTLLSILLLCHAWPPMVRAPHSPR